MTAPTQTLPPLAEVVGLVAATAIEDMDALLLSVPLREITEAAFDLLPSLIDQWALAAGSAAAEWYDQAREINDIDGAFFARVPELGDLGVEQLVGWGTQPLRRGEPDMALTRSRLAGGMQRRVTNVARDTIITSSIEDPGAIGWQRVARPTGCAFCRLLAGRGAVYTENSADFASHDFCHCVAQPAWGGKPLPVKPYRPSARNITDADRARVREWIRRNQ